MREKWISISNTDMRNERGVNLRQDQNMLLLIMNESFTYWLADHESKIHWFKQSSWTQKELILYINRWFTDSNTAQPNKGGVNRCCDSKIHRFQTDLLNKIAGNHSHNERLTDSNTDLYNPEGSQSLLWVRDSLNQTVEFTLNWTRDRSESLKWFAEQERSESL